MPNISAIGAGIYTSLAYIDLPVVVGTGDGTTNTGKGDTAAAKASYFETRETSPTPLTEGEFVEWNTDANARAFGKIREFPNLGIPANVVNVPQYGQATSSQITGQSDPPSLDFTFNYVPSIHGFIDDLRASGEQRLFRVRLSNGELVAAVGGGTNQSGGSDAADTSDVMLPYEQHGSGSDSTMREFSDFFFFGSVASFEIVPSLTDSNQLNVSLTIDGQLEGPYSYLPNASVGTAPSYDKPPNA